MIPCWLLWYKGSLSLVASLIVAIDVLHGRMLLDFQPSDVASERRGRLEGCSDSDQCVGRLPVSTVDSYLMEHRVWRDMIRGLEDNFGR